MILDYSYVQSLTIGAFYTGLYASYNQPFPCPPATYSTGNCTWQPYRSLGICTRFENLTSHLQRYPDASFALPNGLSIGGSTAANVTSLPLKDLESTDSSTHLPAQIPTTIALPQLFNRIADFIIMYNGNGINGGVYEAVLYYCIQEFSTNVTNGVIQTSQIRAWANDSDSNGVETL